jgi:hypothetical protein
MGLAPGDVADLGELDRERAPEAAAVSRDVEAVAGAVEDVVGALAERDRAARWEAAASLRPRLAAVVRDEERRAPVHKDHDRRADGVDIQDALGRPRGREPERALPLDRASGLVAGELVLVRARADLDEVCTVVAAGEDDQRPLRLPSMALTAPLARRAAETGECFRRR